MLLYRMKKTILLYVIVLKQSGEGVMQSEFYHGYFKKKFSICTKNILACTLSQKSSWYLASSNLIKSAQQLLDSTVMLHISTMTGNIFSHSILFVLLI